MINCTVKVKVNISLSRDKNMPKMHSMRYTW